MNSAPEQQLILKLDAYEGPLEVLLELAKTQKLDLTAISILELVDQYLAFVREAKRLNLELAADYLVMAAVLTFLKSQLLLPPSEQDYDAQDPAEVAAALAERLRRLDAMKEAGEKLMSLALLGQDRFATTRKPEASVTTNIKFTAALYDLLTSYAGVKRREETSTFTVVKPKVYKFEEALARLSALLQVKTPTWMRLQDFLPEGFSDESRHMRRSALASTLAASLELAREGKLELKQDKAFAPVMLRPLDQEVRTR